MRSKLKEALSKQDLFAASLLWKRIELNNFTLKEHVMDLKKIDWTSMELAGIDTKDYPDFADAYIQSMDYIDGTPIPDEELDRITCEYSDLVYEAVLKSLF